MEYDSSCKIYSISNDNTCTVCQDSYLLDTKTGKCLRSCEKGFYEYVCDIQTGSLCCIEICGDGLKFILACDDNNTFDGDGCSSTCNIEKNFICSYDEKKLLDKCDYITPLEAKILLPNDSATFIQIKFNLPVVNWNQHLLQNISLSVSIYSGTNSSIIIFKDNRTIEVYLNYNISFKSAEIIVIFSNLHTLIGPQNQTLQTSMLTQQLPNYDYYSFKEEQMQTASSSVSNLIGSSSSFIPILLPLPTYISGLFWNILSSLHFVLYLSLIKIKYPDNFKKVLKQSFQSPFSFIPNIISNYAQKHKIFNSIVSIFTKINFNAIFIINNGSLIIFISILLSIHLILAFVSWLLNKPKLNFIGSGQYFQIFLGNAPYLVLSIMLSIFQMSYSNWFIAISNIISFLVFIFLIMWIHKRHMEIYKSIKRFCMMTIKDRKDNLDNRDSIDNIDNLPVLYPKFRLSALIFGIIDLLQMTMLSLSLIVFENMPITNAISIFTVKLIYLSLVLRNKPFINNTLSILSEAGNLIISLISTIFALDDKYNWFTEETRIIIGWIGVAFVFGNTFVQLLMGLFQMIRKHKSKLQDCLKKENKPIAL